MSWCADRLVGSRTTASDRRSSCPTCPRADSGVPLQGSGIMTIPTRAVVRIVTLATGSEQLRRLAPLPATLPTAALPGTLLVGRLGENGAGKSLGVCLSWLSSRPESSQQGWPPCRTSSHFSPYLSQHNADAALGGSVMTPPGVLSFPARPVPVEVKPLPLRCRLEVWLRVRLWRGEAVGAVIELRPRSCPRASPGSPGTPRSSSRHPTSARSSALTSAGARSPYTRRSSVSNPRRHPRWCGAVPLRGARSPRSTRRRSDRLDLLPPIPTRSRFTQKSRGSVPRSTGSSGPRPSIPSGRRSRSRWRSAPRPRGARIVPYSAYQVEGADGDGVRLLDPGVLSAPWSVRAH